MTKNKEMNLKNVIFFVFLTKKRGKKFSGKGEENKKNTPRQFHPLFRATSKNRENHDE